MSKLVLSGDTSGSVTLDAPAVSGTTTLTLPTTTDTLVGKTTTDTLTNKTLTSPVIAGTPTGVGVLTSDTSKASTSGTTVDFTSIPSWAKRITVMFNGVSTSGTSNLIVQIGDSGGIETTSYVSGASQNTTSTVNLSSATTGFIVTMSTVAASIHYGIIILALQNVSTNSWNSFGNLYRSTDTVMEMSAGIKSLSDVLDRVRITTVNGTDTFDAGSINILYE